jgi:FlaA1/EpsC-like NDP-sugar epimerase
MVLYAWAFSALLVALGRLLSSWLCRRLIRKGWGHRRVLVVGTGDIARMILQKVLWTPELGYDAVGVVSNNGGGTDSVLGVRWWAKRWTWGRLSSNIPRKR